MLPGEVVPLVCVLLCFVAGAPRPTIFVFFFFNDTATTEIYTLSLHDALPISLVARRRQLTEMIVAERNRLSGAARPRSEEHTSELQSQSNLVCRLLLEKKKSTSVSRR